MKVFFVVAKANKDGTDSKIRELLSTYDLQLKPIVREKWIRISVKDAVAT